MRRLSKTPDASPAPGESLFDSGLLDSFGLPDLVTELETGFGVAIPDSDLLPSNFAALQAIDAYLSKKLG